MYNAGNISHLGVTASHKRSIRSGSEYDHLFPKPDRKDPLMSAGASVYDTLEFMAEIVGKTKSDTAAIATRLKTSNLKESCRNIWEFCYNHIQYKQDKPGEEQLRRPARSWADRKEGIDCDCFSILVSSILSNMGINHALRICEINAKGYFQHVYVIVPNGTGYIIIDPVLDKFNLEAPGITKTHDKMIPVRYLNGIDDENISAFGAEFDGLSGCSCNSGAQVAQQFNNRLAAHLRNTRNAVAAKSCSLGGLYDQSQMIGALDFALASADDPELFEGALEQLAGLDSELIVDDLFGFEGLYGDDVELGKAKTAKKPGVFTKAAAAVKTVKQAAQKATSKESINKLKDAAQKAGKAIVKVNPLTAAARAGLLLSMEINMFGMADQLRWAYATPEQLQRYGVSAQEQARAKSVLAKVENLFATKLQGNKENLKKAILSGKQALKGLSGMLGEPVTAATGTAAASAFIAQIVKWIKEAGLKIQAKNPELVTSAKQAATKKITDKIFGKKAAATVQNNAVVTTQAPTPPDNSFPDAPAIRENMELTPADSNNVSENSSLPAMPPAAEETSTVPPAPAPAPEKKGGGMLLLLGIATAAVVFLGGGNNNGGAKRALAGAKNASKRKPSKKTTKRKTKKTIKIS